MSKCSSIDDIKRKISTIISINKFKKSPLEVFKKDFSKALLEISKDMEMTLLSSAVDEIYNIVVKHKLTELSDRFFNAQNIRNTLTGYSQGLISELETSTDNILPKEKPQVQLRRNVTSLFLTDAFGMVTDARTYFKNIANLQLFDVFLINRRNTVQGLKLGAVSAEDLNQNVRNYQQFLLNNIIEYLKLVIPEDNNLTDLQKLMLEDGKLYNGSEVTNILEVLNPIIDTYLSTSNFKSLSDPTGRLLDGLRALYNRAFNKMESNREEAKLKLTAYNSVILLNNFDLYLLLAFGDMLEIQNFSKMSGDKYAIGTKLAKLLSTWTNSDERDVEEETNFITKMAIATTLQYYWKDNTPRDNKYLTFADFLYMVGKIKNIAFNPNILSIRIGEINSEGKIKETSVDKDFWESLSQETKDVLTETARKNKSFSYILSQLRRNPRKYTGVVFELLSNKHFYAANLNLYKDFLQSDLDKLYSLYKGVFSPADLESLYNLSDVYGKSDYYSYITLVVDSIFNVDFIQYYRDLNGVLRPRTFISQSINNLKRNIETSINTANSTNTIKLESLVSKYQIKDGHFTIPGTDIVVTPSPLFVLYKRGNNKVQPKDFWKDVLQFIDDVLRLNILDNPELQNAILNVYDNKIDVMTKDLLNLASKIVMRRYTAFTKVDIYPEVLSKENALRSIYGEKGPKYDRLLDMVNSVCEDDANTIKRIAKAKADLYGITSATSTKDGEGNSQNLQTYSRLLGSHLSQFDLIERNANSATRNSLILNIPGLYEGTLTFREYYDDINGSKASTEMCVSEHIYANFVCDYIGGLINRGDDNDIIGNGHVMFLPSVNSDKNTIGRIKIDLNKLIIINGQLKKFSELTVPEIKYVIAQSLGTYYLNMYRSVQEDWNNLNDFIKNNLFLDIPAFDYINDFKEFNDWWETKYLSGANVGESPLEFILKAILKYNNSVNAGKSNRNKPLAFIDQTHYQQSSFKLLINGKFKSFKTIKANKVLLALIARFKPGEHNLQGYPTEDFFWKRKNKEVLKSILKSRLLINLTGKDSEEYRYLRSRLGWVNLSGNVVFAKINGVDISATRDILKLKTSDSQSVADIIDNAENIELHPDIETWNCLDYLFTLEFMNCTVGSFTNHPEKSGSNDVLEMEAGHFNALHKRNVSHTASMHQFELNTLNGIPDTYNIAVIEDIKDILGTIVGTLNTIKPFDGATFVNPFVVILENNSLAGQRAGITKKQFVHFKDARTGTGGIIKTAGFGLTNDWIRNCPMLSTMMRRMTDHEWLNLDGTKAVVDITKDYKGNPINVSKGVHFKLGNKVYEIVNIKSTGRPNEYIRTLREIAIDDLGRPIKNTDNGTFDEKPQIINTNYSLWNYLGGDLSMSAKGEYLEYSNISVERVVDIMNLVGLGKADAKTQDDLYQPLKHSDIHYIPTAGAVKLGAANINSADKYLTVKELSSKKSVTEEDLALDFYQIKMYLAGILLDKEHHADLAELSLMTLVISACAARGYTFEAASKIYNALRLSTELGIKEHLKGLEKYVESDDPEGIQEAMYEAIIHSLGTAKDSNSFAYLVASDIILLAREGKKIRFSEVSLPLSDKTVYSKIFSTIASYLTNSGIKFKIPGILSVLTPSYNIFKLYGDKKYEQYTDPERQLLELLRLTAPVYEAPQLWTPETTWFRNLNLIYVEPNTLISSEDGLPVAMSNRHDGNVYVDIELMKLKYMEKAWRNSRNSKPLDKDFNTFQEWVQFALTREAMHDIYQILEGETRYDYETRINNEALKRIDNNISNLSLGRTYIITREVLDEYLDPEGNLVVDVYPIKEKRLIQTPKDYRKLKDDILLGGILEVVEDVTVGRNLAAYNCRFKSAKGEQFQLYDIDSIYYLFLIEEIKSDKSLSKKEKDAKILEITSKLFPDSKDGVKDLRRMLLRDLQALSKSSKNILESYDNMINNLSLQENLIDYYSRWVNIYLGTGNGNILQILGIPQITTENFGEILKLVRKYLASTTKVRINDKLVDVDKSSISVEPYEVILPKIFMTNFGLKEFDNLLEIRDNRDWFVNLYINNSLVLVDDINFSVALKTSKGDHTYLISKSLVKGLTKVDDSNIGKIVMNGKTLRVDNKDNIMYEITDDFELYLDDLGREIIATDNFEYYLNNMQYDSIEFSKTLLERPNGLFRPILNSLKKSKNKIASLLYKYISYGGLDNLKNVFDLSIEYFTIPPKNDPAYNTNKLVRYLREKHTSFVKSLDVIAARIPSQSMQSFMPMRAIAFDNPDINTAFVNTMQILLLGSDYDIDAVSIMTFDINRNGKLLLWSPYANIDNIQMLEASANIPLPTGESIEFEESTKLVPTRDFLKKYKDILNLHVIIDPKTGKLSETELDVRFDLQTAEQIQLFSEFLKEVQDLKIPPKRYYQNLVNYINEDQIIDNITVLHVPSLFANIKLLVDRHNLYFESLSSHNLFKIMNNYDTYNTYKVSSDPVNLIESQTPVDSTTEPLKKKTEDSTEFKETSTRTPGNVINKFEAIVENLTGKEGISICATGLKSFFGLSLYCNYMLNYGTDEEQKRLLFLDGGISIKNKRGEKIYYTIANIRALDINTIKNSEVFKALSLVTLDEDIALTLSALLSLATDNAKELALSKLNAGTKMLGMYIYGLTIGMDFNDIADILMSDVGNIVKTMLDDDKFSERDAFSSVGESLFKYFKEGPKRYLYNFDRTESPSGVSIRSPFKTLLRLVQEGSDSKKGLADILVEFAKNTTIPLKLKLDYFEQLRKYHGLTNYEGVEMFNQLIDFVQDYLQQSNVIYNNTDDFNNIIKLSVGASELKVLGLILGLNQGVKTSPDELLTLINNLRRAIYNKTGNLEDLVDLTKFVFDKKPYTDLEGNTYPNYLEYVINKYENYKNAFNLFDIVTKIPHFYGYLKTLVTTYNEVRNSFTFRSTDNLLLPVKTSLGKYIKEDKLTLGLQNYCGDWILNHWLIDSGKIVTIPKGNKYFKPDGTLDTLEKDTRFYLGTLHGNATFRLWMENEVIPNLKLGILKKGTKWTKISDNKFIKDLGNDLFTKTVSGNPSVIYTLPINMLPSNDIERSMFNRYKSEFNDLNDNYIVEAEIDVLNPDGTLGKLQITESHSIIDLFTYYAMIANNWKLNQSSLVSILEDFLNIGIIKDFHDYVAELDKSGFLLSADNIVYEDLLPYVAPKESPYTSSSLYIMARNPRTLKKVLMLKNSGDHEGGIGRYIPYTPMSNLNYFPTTKLDTGNSVINVDGHSITYNTTSGLLVNVTNLTEELKLELIRELKTVTFIKKGKLRVPNTILIKLSLENVKNRC